MEQLTQSAINAHKAATLCWGELMECGMATDKQGGVNNIHVVMSWQFNKNQQRRYISTLLHQYINWMFCQYQSHVL